MISLVTGPLRSGKTSYVVGLVVEHLAKGLTVFTNVEMFPDHIDPLLRKRYRRKLDPSQIRFVDLVADKNWNDLISWGSPGAPVLVVLDEIHLHFNSRDWAKTQKLHSDMLGFLSQSGKCFVDVIFIAQVANTLEKQFREQCEFEFYCKNLKTIHIPLLGPLPLNRMLLVERDRKTETALSRRVLPYDMAIWKCYNSFAFLDASMQEAEKTMVRIKRLELERVPRISKRQRLALVFAVLGLALYYYLHLA